MSSKRVCPWCKRPFFPHLRLGHRQKSCGKPECKRRQKALSQSRWISKNKKVYLDNQCDWRKNHPHYWKQYRISHPAYVIRNRVQSRVRKVLALSKTGLQKRIDILQLDEMTTLFWNIPRFAKSPRSLIPILFARTSNIPNGEFHDQKSPHRTIIP